MSLQCIFVMWSDSCIIALRLMKMSVCVPRGYCFWFCLLLVDALLNPLPASYSYNPLMYCLLASRDAKRDWRYNYDIISQPQSRTPACVQACVWTLIIIVFIQLQYFICFTLRSFRFACMHTHNETLYNKLTIRLN